MQIVQVDELPMLTRTSGGRGGTWEYRRVMSGDPDDPGNFSLVIYYHNGSFYSPRHHHNFDQFRFQLDGDADFARSGKMTTGTLGYFPEGAYYGPTTGPAHIVAVLQFAGPSGSGYMGSRGRAARVEMESFGRFEKGVFRRNDDVEGRKNQDSSEAIWEHVHKRKLVYPEPQYAGAIMIETGLTEWSPVEGLAGVEKKALATFTNCKIPAACYKISAGSSFRTPARGIYMVLTGTGQVEDQPMRAQTVVYVDADESACFTAETTAEILLMGMPRVADMAQKALEAPLVAG